MSLSPRIRIKGREIQLTGGETLGTGDIHRFLHRAFAHADTGSVRVEHAKRRFSIVLVPGEAPAEASLPRLAELMGRSSVPETSLPTAPEQSTITYHRWRGIVTILSLQDQALGEVRVLLPNRSQKKRGGEALGRLRALPGVHRARSRRFGSGIVIGYDPTVDPTIWIRELEASLYPSAHGTLIPRMPESSNRISSTNLALCTTGQFFYPPAIPVVSGILLLSRIPQFMQAGRELKSGKVGSPFYGSVVVLCSVASMAPFASALAEWLTQVWERRAQKQIFRESGRLIAEAPIQPQLPAPGEIRKPLALTEGMIIPFDGTLSQGDLLVRDVLFRTGDEAPIERKRKGDLLVSGYQVVRGSGKLTPQKDLGDDRLTSAIRVLAGLPVTLFEDPVLTADARRVGDFSVLPNLALSGLAFMSGGLHMAGAVLHQDWTAAPKIAAPTEFFKDLRTGLPYGVLVRTPDALKGLATTDVLLIEATYPGLKDMRPRVSDIVSDSKSVSRANDWAKILSAWVGDDRALALNDLARISDHEVHDSELLGFENGRTTLRIDGHVVVLEDLMEGGAWPSLRLSVEGEPSETLRFTATDRPRFGDTLKKLRGLGVATVVYGPSASELSTELGVDAVYPDLDQAGLQRFREDLEKKGYRSGMVVTSGTDVLITEGASVVIGPLSAIQRVDAPTIQLLGTSLEALPDLLLAARTLRLRTGLASLRTVPTNLLCILGAFAGRFNGTMTTVIAHAGVLGVSLLQGYRVKKPHPPLLAPKER